MPKVSIVIPSYNHASFLMERLTTIAKQTYSDWEAIIIDDNSTDNSIEIIENFLKDNPNFKVKHFIVNESNSGSGYNSWKKGIELAATEYIWIAETDDYSSLSFLEEQVKVLKSDPNIALSFSASNYVDNNGDFLYSTDKRTSDLVVNGKRFKVFDSQVFVKRMPFNPYITNASAVLFRKPIQAIPDEIFSYPQSSDAFLWTFLIFNSSFAFLNNNLNFFRRHINSTTTKMSFSNKKEVFKEKIKYIRFFKLTDKDVEVVSLYFKFFVRYNKFNFFNVDIFDSFELKVKYFLLLFPNCIKLIVKGK